MSIIDHTCIGMISGSSLDGLDIALANFRIDPNQNNPILSWNLERAKTFEFTEPLIERLRALPNNSAIALIQMDDHLGDFMAQCAIEMLDGQAVDLIASHGHTVFHHPGKSSTQIGNPAIIAAKTGIDTIGHLRNMDTAHGGQGAPLAPMADLYLFPENDVCINLGGIANISVKSKGQIIGYDVCGANQFLNYLAQKEGKSYDNEGQLARSGSVSPKLLSVLNNLPYCQMAHPKSLDNEEVRAMYIPILEKADESNVDQMCTMVEHIAEQLSKSTSPDVNSAMLAGGGANNTFLVERIKDLLPCPVVIPEKSIIDFKEAILIAMCGALRLHKVPNCLKSITGASKNTVNGVVFKA